jgi:dTMP kinase
MERNKCDIFVSVEGVDGAGKSSAIRTVGNFFRRNGLDVVETREPGGTPLGEQLRNLLIHQQMDLETEALLMFASRREHLARVIRPALERGQVVVSDRFTDSSFAFQGGGRGLSISKLEVLETWVQEELRPNLTLLLDVPIEVASQRMSAGRELDKFEREEAAFHIRVREEYLRRASQYPDRIRTVDATKSTAQVALDIESILGRFLESRGLAPKSFVQ